jgi:hypothetical protein
MHPSNAQSGKAGSGRSMKATSAGKFILQSPRSSSGSGKPMSEKSMPARSTKSSRTSKSAH